MSMRLGFYLFECESIDNTILIDTRFPCIYISNVSNCGINSNIKISVTKRSLALLNTDSLLRKIFF